jgi:hypothetical protein
MFVDPNDPIPMTRLPDYPISQLPDFPITHGGYPVWLDHIGVTATG